jgi:Asp-tRNA(Asn)/Glu-tRNA(Gln) amidotransferase A subunit family amidase
VPFFVHPNAFGGDSPFLFKGPITRTVEDAALTLTVLASYDPRDPFSLDELAADFTAATRRSTRGFRTAYSPNFDVFPLAKYGATMANVDDEVLFVADVEAAFAAAVSCRPEVFAGARSRRARLCRSGAWPSPS